MGCRLRAALERGRGVCAPAASEARPALRCAHAAHRPRRRLSASGTAVTRLAARIRRLPLRVRLTLAGTLLLPVPLAIVFGLVFLRFEGALNATIDGDLRARADAVAVMLRSDGSGALDGVAAQELLRPLGAFAQVVDRRGRVLDSTDAVAHVRLLTSAQAATAATDGLLSEHGRIPNVAKRSRLVAEALPGGDSALVVGRSLGD